MSVAPTAATPTPRRALHVFATFGPGGPQIRAVQLVARMRGWRHDIVAMDGEVAAAAQLPADAACELLPTPRRRSFLASVRAQRALLRERRPDLLLTYNWGSIECVAAARSLGVTAHVHHEDGFLTDELERRLWRRNWLRRFLLARVHVVVPSTGLLRIAQQEWGIATERALHLPNGVDCARFRPAHSAATASTATGSSGLGHGPWTGQTTGQSTGQLTGQSTGRPPDASMRPNTDGAAITVGTVGGLRDVKDHANLLRAVAAMRHRARVLLVGDGAERGRLQALARELGIHERTEFAGAVADTAPVYHRMDVFVLSSRTEQMPISMLEAMASGLPIASTDVGDVRAMLPPEHRAAVVPAQQPGELARVLDELAADPGRRRAEGEGNRAHCARHYELDACLRRYVELYERTARPGR